MNFSPIEKYLQLNGRLTADQSKKYARSIYDAYKVAVAAGYPTANPVGPKAEYQKTVQYVSQQVIIKQATVELFFRALYNSILEGINKSEDLFIATGKKVAEQKAEDLKNKFGLNVLGKYGAAVLGTVAIASIAVIVFKFKKQPK